METSIKYSNGSPLYSTDGVSPSEIGIWYRFGETEIKLPDVFSEAAYSGDGISELKASLDYLLGVIIEKK